MSAAAFDIAIIGAGPAGSTLARILSGRATAGLRIQLRLKNLKTPFMYNPLLRRAVMASGLKHLPLVELGS